MDTETTLRQITDELRAAREEHRRDTAMLRAEIALVRASLEGTLGTDGLVAQVRQLRSEVEELRQARWRWQGAAVFLSMVAAGAVSLGLRAL
jgi:hypothetical protein